MKTSQQFAEERKVNQVKYSVEDFADSITDLRHPAIAHVIATAILLLSIVIAGADNVLHLNCCLLTALILFYASRTNLFQTDKLTFLGFGYVLILAVEFIGGKMMDLLIPQLNMHEWRGFPVFVNHAIPYIYLGARVMLVYYVVAPWVYRSKMMAQDEQVLQPLLRERDFVE